jgi:N-methylhydantoinase B
MPSKKSLIRLKPGDLVSVRTAGGGGFGDPQARSPDLIAADTRNGRLGET